MNTPFINRKMFLNFYFIQFYVLIQNNNLIQEWFNTKSKVDSKVKMLIQILSPIFVYSGKKYLRASLASKDFIYL